MHASLTRHRIDRPTYAWIAVALQILTALTAIPVGLMLIVRPDGSLIQLPSEWIEATPFESYLVPGLFLLGMNGIGQVLAAVLIVARHEAAPWLTGGLGVGLMIWIGVQVALMPFHPLQPTLFTVGLVEGFVALFWLRRLGHLRR